MGQWTDSTTNITWNYTLDGSDATIGTGSTSVNGNGTTSGTSISGALTIPDTVGGYTVKTIGTYSFRLCTSLTSVTIPDTVLSIDVQAFLICSNIESVTFGNSLTSMATQSFHGCTKLASFTLPNTLTTIGNNCFQGTDALTSVTIPASVTSIGNQGFAYCIGLTSVIIEPYGELHTIGTSAFIGCNSLTSITLPDTVTIGSSCFTNTHADLTVTMNTRTIGSITYTSPTTSDIAFFGNPSVTLVLPPPPPPHLEFIDHILTIENSINASDTDAVRFTLPVNNEMASLNVTNFSGSGTISYTISATGVTTIIGTIVDGIVTVNGNAGGTNLLANNLLVANAGVDITYTLTLAANAAITYTIVGTKNVNLGVISSISSVINARTVYNTATTNMTNGDDAIMEDSGIKIEFLQGTAGETTTTHLPFRDQVSDYYGWWSAPTTSTAHGFVGNNDTAWSDFPCIGSHMSDQYANEGSYTGVIGEGCHPDWLAFHPAPGANDTNTYNTKLFIKVTPSTNSVITGYTLYYQAINAGSVSIETGQNGTNTVTHSSRTALTGTSTSAPTGWEYEATVDAYSYVKKYTKTLTNNITDSDYLYIYIDDTADFGADASTLKLLLNVDTNVITPTDVSFSNNILTIQNSINQNDTDTVGFTLPVADEMHQLVVTNYAGTGEMNYEITTGATIIKSGTISNVDENTAIGTNLLDGNQLTSAVGSTYEVTFSGATAPISYTIIGTKVSDYGDSSTPTTLVFSNNMLTIDNVTSTNDTDVIDFVLPAGYNIPELNVTKFNGTGNVTYTLATGGNTVAIGTFSAISSNLLPSGFPIFALSTDVTYVLTITTTATATIGYTIVGTKAITNLSNYSTTHFFISGLTEQQLIDGGVWDADSNANHFNSTYIEGFLDISGNVKVTDNILMDTGDIDLHSFTYTDPHVFTADVPINNRLFVVGDVSMGDASLNIVGDIYINGTMSVGSYQSQSISLGAIAGGGGSSTANSITTFTEDITYGKKIKFNGDISLNMQPDDTIFFHNNDGNHIFDSGDANATQLKWEDLDISTTGQYQIAVVGGAYLISGYGGAQHQYTAHTGNVWISTNFGETWVEKTVGGGAKQWTSAMISGNGAIMTVKAVGNVLYRSTDTGESWSNVNFPYAEIVPYPTVSDPAWSARPGAKMVMDSVGDYLCTYYLVSTNVHRVVYSEDGGTNWTTNTNTDGPISSLSISKTKKYVIILYAASSGTYRPKYSADSGATFIELTNGPSFTSAAGPTIWSTDAYISDNGKVGIDGYGKNPIYNTDVTTGTITGVSPNQANDATFSEYAKYGTGSTENGMCFSISASHDGRYIVVLGREEVSGAKELMFHISYDYGANYTRVTETWPINTSPNMSRPLAFRFSADNNYMAAIREFDNIYVRQRLTGYEANPNAITYFGENTKLKANTGIEFPDGTTIYSSNKEINGTTFKASKFESMTVNGEFSSPNAVVETSDYRIKTNVETLDEIHTVDNLRPVKYKQTQTGKNDIGFLAHELQEHYPELVEGEKDGDKMQSVNYSGLLPILINEVQQLKKQIAETRARIHNETP